MLTHIVCFKYKPEIDEATRQEHRAALKNLARLDGVVSLKVGADVVHASRSYDTGLIIEFRGRAELDAYQKNPQHIPVAQRGVELAAHIVAVDFET
jgi:hypothetical protein